MIKEITANQVKKWPSKGKVSPSLLSVKYAILYRIGSANWAPSNHTSIVSASLARLIYAVGTKGKVDFGTYVFDQVLKHGDSFAVKMPIAFPCLLSELILSQYPNILRANEEQFFKGTLMNFDYRLFAGSQVKDIEIPTAKDSDHSASMTEPVKENILSELNDTSKALQETIRICSDKKEKIDKLIEQLQAEQEDVEEEVVAEEEEAMDEDEDEDEASAEEGGSEDEESDEEGAETQDTKTE